jgi:hypothetical protein
LSVFTLKGKIISKDKNPVEGLRILAYDDDPLLNTDDFLGESTTDSNGLFKIDFDKSKFSGFLEPLEQTPDIYLIAKDARGNEILTTNVMQTQKEIEYHIKTFNNSDPPPTPDPNAKDIYAGNLRRMISMLNEVGNIIGIENRINLDTLQKNRDDLPEEVKHNLEEFVNGYEERRNNFNHFMVIVSSVGETFLEEMHIGDIGYDGPQVPRQPRRESYNQVIIWPRKEQFAWG